MAKYSSRPEAQNLRKEVYSTTHITIKFCISKSTAILWYKDMVLSDEQYKKLRKNKGISTSTGQRMRAEKNKQKKINAIGKAHMHGKK